ncbi:MAG: hypothetical protein F9K44_09195 [Hyphomicrobiaceae bacterium]|nr:MAG: hypothetical protein F9K44_09195 [Hyphomicrobiaceae bacterium]
MKKIAIITALALVGSAAFAQTTPAPTTAPKAPATAPKAPATAQKAPPTCKAQATEKKLAGAALASFLKKCGDDAGKACTKQAADKKLTGAAKDSFTKKCKTDAVGA